MLELFIYKEEGSMPVEISKRQFDLIDRTNAKETTVIYSEDGIRTNTAVFEGGKIVSIKSGQIYRILDGGFFLDEGGYSLLLDDIPEINDYCLEHFVELDRFLTIIIIEHLG